MSQRFNNRTVLGAVGGLVAVGVIATGIFYFADDGDTSSDPETPVATSESSSAPPEQQLLIADDTCSLVDWQPLAEAFTYSTDDWLDDISETHLEDSIEEVESPGARCKAGLPFVGRTENSYPQFELILIPTPSTEFAQSNMDKMNARDDPSFPDEVMVTDKPDCYGFTSFGRTTPNETGELVMSCSHQNITMFIWLNGFDVDETGREYVENLADNTFVPILNSVMSTFIR